MRKQLLLIPILLIAAACASSSSGPPVEVEAVPLNLASDILFFPGPLEIQFAVTVTNASSQQVTIRALELRTIGPGAFTLNSGKLQLNRVVPPGATEEMKLSTWGQSLGGYTRSQEPIQLRGNATFSTKDNKSFVKVFNQVLTP